MKPSTSDRNRSGAAAGDGAPTVALAIPAFQAAASVGDVARRALALVEAPPVAGARLAEVLVVDDGSTDATARAAADAGARVVSLPRNQGKGRALATAFDELFARGHAAVVTLDADGQHLPEEVPVLLAAWAGAPEAARPHLVLGSRQHLFGGMGGVRRTSNRLSSVLISAAAGIDLADVQSGFRLYSRELIAAIGFPEARFEAESAVVVRAVRAGFRVIAVPVSLGFADGRVTSHYRPLVDSLRIARAVTAARLEAFRWVPARSW
ncbi:MAG TPA: glycosyltransferase family 2 protein [Thermoanaerobaculia bacterium]